MGSRLASEANAVVLLSGGLDSATTLAIARSEGYRVHCLSFDYGQRHTVELAAAERVADVLGATAHRTVPIDLAAFGGSALTDQQIAVPRDRDESQMSQGIPVTYVPARNTVFLALALAWAEVLPAADIFIGVNALDYSGYPDCRPEFIRAFEQLANLATRMGVEGTAIRIHAPLIQLTKAQIIRSGTELGIDYAMTISCYDPDAEGGACRGCDACQLRARGFSEAGVADPTSYRLDR
jgi:7-cyano-7-deazaguanine synthase